MKNLVVRAMILSVLLSCSSEVELRDSHVLMKLVEADQNDRMNDSDEPIAPKDDLRRMKVIELLANGSVVTPQDKYNAALILQHTGMVFSDGTLKSKSVENHYLAYQLAKAAYESGLEEARYFVAVTYDRYLWMSKGFQKYGTQSTFVDDREIWVEIDTLTTDEERAEYLVKPLSELLELKPGK